MSTPRKIGWNHLWRSRRARFYGLCLAWSVVVALAHYDQLGILVKQELRTLDRRFQLRGEKPAAPEIVILAIDQRSIVADVFTEEELVRSPQLAKLNQYPFSRSVYADAIERLFAAGAKVVAIDLLFLSPKDEDERLREVIAAHPDRIVIGSNFSDDGRQLMLPSAVVPDTVPTESVAGYVNYWPDPDRFVRRARLETYASEEAGVPRLEDEPLLQSFDALVVKRFAPHTPLPDRDKDAYVHFAGPPGSFPTHPIYQLFYDKAWEQNLRNGEVFRDKIVLIGPGGNFQHDTKPTPFADGSPSEMPGVEIHASTIGTVLHGEYLRDAPAWVGLLTMVLLALAAATLLNTSFHPVVKVAALLGVCVGYAAVACAAFIQFRLVMLVAAPLWIVCGGGILGIVLQLVAERLEKLHVRQTLERYVSRPVAEVILRHSSEYQHSLGGERKHVTILFSDIRGFTPFSEKLSPIEVVQVLNEYLTAMVDEVMKHDGTLDKFIGDAIMALYGAPMSQGPAEDAWRAVQTAHGMRVRLAELQENWKRQGRPPIQIGIGINHGEVVVGNIGSPQRMEYTVIGDAVNVASRVEGLNKEFGTDILLTESVHELVKDRATVVPIGEASVKGRQQKIKLYALKSLQPPGSHAVSKPRETTLVASQNRKDKVTPPPALTTS